MRFVLAIVLASIAASTEAQTGASLSKKEQTRLKAEAARPPTAAQKKRMAEQVKKMDFGTLCSEAGRAFRAPRTTASGKHWDGLVVARANFPAGDIRPIKERRLALGIDECSAIAILGKPDAQTRSGQSNQLVYRERKIYVYTDNGVVRGWQD